MTNDRSFDPIALAEDVLEQADAEEAAQVPIELTRTGGLVDGFLIGKLRLSADDSRDVLLKMSGLLRLANVGQFDLLPREDVEEGDVMTVIRQAFPVKMPVDKVMFVSMSQPLIPAWVGGRCHSELTERLIGVSFERVLQDTLRSDILSAMIRMRYYQCVLQQTYDDGDKSFAGWVEDVAADCVGDKVNSPAGFNQLYWLLQIQLGLLVGGFLDKLEDLSGLIQIFPQIPVLGRKFPEEGTWIAGVK